MKVSQFPISTRERRVPAPPRLMGGHLMRRVPQSIASSTVNDGRRVRPSPSHPRAAHTRRTPRPSHPRAQAHTRRTGCCAVDVDLRSQRPFTCANQPATTATCRICRLQYMTQHAHTHHPPITLTRDVHVDMCSMAASSDSYLLVTPQNMQRHSRATGGAVLNMMRDGKWRCCGCRWHRCGHSSNDSCQ